jgi:hypothetical protein
MILTNLLLTASNGENSVTFGFPNCPRASATAALDGLIHNLTLIPQAQVTQRTRLLASSDHLCFTDRCVATTCMVICFAIVAQQRVYKSQHYNQ